MQPHRMHLKGPWQYEWLDPPKEPSEGRVKMPTEWQTVFGKQAGTVRFRRRFGMPTNLEENEHVFLAFDGLGGSAELWVNGTWIAHLENAAGTVRFDITAFLQPRNVLTVELHFDPKTQPGQPGGLWAPVAIEIHQVEQV